LSDDNRHQSPAELNADAYRRHVERELEAGRLPQYVGHEHGPYCEHPQPYDVPEKTTRTYGKDGWQDLPTTQTVAAQQWEDDPPPQIIGGVTVWKDREPEAGDIPARLHVDPNPPIKVHLDEPAYDDSEQDVLMHVFCVMLWAATRDGGKKREAGTKVPWWRDESHMAAVWSHFRKRELGQMDENSGAHPYVHAAWRLLAEAYQETYGQVDPEAREGL
jgi:hypothetical protein